MAIAIHYWSNKWHTLISKDTSGFTSNTLLIRFPIMLSVHIVYRMHKVERRMVKTNATKEMQSALEKYQGEV